jgi:hypothetical protein
VIALGKPFVLRSFDALRLETAAALLNHLPLSDQCLAIARSSEPFPIWQENWLRIRYLCYRQAGDPRTARAADDLREYQRYSSESAGTALLE